MQSVQSVHSLLKIGTAPDRVSEWHRWHQTIGGSFFGRRAVVRNDTAYGERSGLSERRRCLGPIRWNHHYWHRFARLDCWHKKSVAKSRLSTQPSVYVTVELQLRCNLASTWHRLGIDLESTGNVLDVLQSLAFSTTSLHIRCSSRRQELSVWKCLAFECWPTDGMVCQKHYQQIPTSKHCLHWCG